MNNKMMMYLLTGRIEFLLFDTQTAMMFMLMGVNIFGQSGTTTGLQNVSLQTIAPLMLMGGMGKRRYYRSRPRTVVYNRRYYSRRWR